MSALQNTGSDTSRRHSGSEIMRLEAVGKSYGGPVPVVDDLDLALREGEFLTLLGPSGCGKSTTLRLLAGLERPDRGRILLHGRDITNDPPHRRPVNTVFQDYALFPHLSVRGNVAFGLKVQRIASAEIRRRTDAMLEMVGLQAFASQRPQSLSGGQKQRVALARALIREPSVLLLDEPLSALDAQLRLQMQAELKSLQARVGITFMLVTHDQVEALSLSDRIAVMQGGRILQAGTPEQLYDRPACGFVASFLGATNLLPGQVETPGMVSLGDGGPSLQVGLQVAMHPGSPCLVSIRPEDVCLAGAEGFAANANVIEAQLRRVRFRGGTQRLECRVAGGATVLCDVGRHGGSLPEPGGSVRLLLPAARVRVLPA